MPNSTRVVLADESGHAVGSALKSEVHHLDTPLHFAFSCYVFDSQGRFLATRRSLSKLTWPGVWTNSCCGHPAPGERIGDAAHRRLQQELGLTPTKMGMVLPDFRYRTTMDNGIVENEICPVFAAFVTDGEPSPDPSEVADYDWFAWPSFRDRARSGELQVSPWATLQIDLLVKFSDDPKTWPMRDLSNLPTPWDRPLIVGG